MKDDDGRGPGERIGRDKQEDNGNNESGRGRIRTKGEENKRRRK
jgi:hypothetical protein